MGSFVFIISVLYDFALLEIGPLVSYENLYSRFEVRKRALKQLFRMQGFLKFPVSPVH